MAKFHINSKDMPAPCRAQKGNCPYGGEENHFDSKEKAQEYINIKSQEEFGLLGATPTQTPYTHDKDNFERLENLIEHLGADKVLEELSYALPDDELKNVLDSVINDWDMKDYIDEDYTTDEKMDSIKRMIGTERAVDNMAKWLSSDDLRENIDHIEDNWGTEDEEDEWMAFEDEHNNKIKNDIIESDIKSEPKVNYEEKLNELGERLNNHTKQLIEEVEQWLDDTEMPDDTEI